MLFRAPDIKIGLENDINVWIDICTEYARNGHDDM